MVASLNSDYTVYMGGILSAQFEGDQTYEDLLCANMDFLTDTNGCKWRNALNDDFAHCTKALEFAQECGMEYRVVQMHSVSIKVAQFCYHVQVPHLGLGQRELTARLAHSWEP